MKLAVLDLLDARAADREPGWLTRFDDTLMAGLGGVGERGKSYAYLSGRYSAMVFELIDLIGEEDIRHLARIKGRDGSR